MGTLRRQQTTVDSVDEDTIDVKLESPAPSDLAEELSSTRSTAIKDEAASSTSSSPSLSTIKVHSSWSSSQSTSKSKAMEDAAMIDTKRENANGHISPLMEPESPIKESRASRKGIPRVAPLFDHLPDATLEATSYFQILDVCTYANKYLGYTEHAMECDCSEEWGMYRRMLHVGSYLRSIERLT
jgi:histone-lysine N-methyltransferase SETD2